MYFSYVWNSTQPDQRNVGEFLWNIFVIPKDSTYGAHLVRVGGGGAVLLPHPTFTHTQASIPRPLLFNPYLRRRGMVAGLEI